MSQLAHPDEIRGLFSRAMSDMYRSEVPQYATLCTLVAEVNVDCCPVAGDAATCLDF